MRDQELVEREFMVKGQFWVNLGSKVGQLGFEICPGLLVEQNTITRWDSKINQIRMSRPEMGSFQQWLWYV